ncbi:hypothetical protein CLOM_g6384 [Closterium sp. NIES-68]|nr:hypothetical protein CLOM_g6384 [Closterium sp. NIES-68]GJP58681.1 hypothetical protein CLOP_g2271 [Closterium sp. NIES-67]GJP68838.1 hypothetical protein CLOP_g25489 [Closterium sp. NIES-67]
MAGSAGAGDRRILVEWLDPVIVKITINRPEALNSLTRPMMRELAQAFKRIRVEGRARAVILTGAGRAFCAGVDLTAAQSVFQGDVTDEETDVVVQMERCPMPIIGAINGHAITAGFEIALACDILIGSSKAKFADTHSKFGIFPSWGLSQKLPRLIGVNRAREVSLTAEPVNSETAERWGLLSRVVDADKLMPTAIAIAKTVAGNHPGLVLRYKAVINDGIGLTLSEGRQLETERARAYYKQMTPQDFEKMKVFIAARPGKSKL